MNWDYRYLEVYKVNDEVTAYPQQDLGSTSLLNKLEEHGHNEYVYGLFCKSLYKLAQLQIKGHRALDYNWCLTAARVWQAGNSQRPSTLNIIF